MIKSIKFSMFMALLSTFTFLLSTVAYGDTHTAASCSSSDVQAAITAASDGDTVQIPNGSATWSTSVSITNKAITLKGNGVYAVNASHQDTGTWPLTITLSNTGVNISENGTQNARVTGIVFAGTTYSGSGMSGAITIGGMSGNIRVDNCKFTVSGNSIAETISGAGGLVDHIYVQSPSNGGYAGQLVFADKRNDEYGNWAWMQPVGFGGPNFVFIEDSTFWRACDNIANSSCFTDAEGNGKFVFRHNYLCGGMLGSHGSESGNPYRSGMAYEVYNNEFFWDRSVGGQADWYYFTLFFLRGGSVMLHDNKVTEYTNLLNTWVRRTEATFGVFGKCDGSSVWDGNSGVSGAPGYPCLDQIGRGNAAGLTGAAVQTQAQSKCYLWNNNFIKGGTKVTGTVGNNNPAYVVQGRDYELCDDGSCAPQGYTPYTYPHPLQAGGNPPPPTDTTAPSAPAAVRDGSGTDVGSTMLTTQLSANWDAAADAESGIAKYYYAIGTTAGGTNTLGWTDNGTGLSVARTGLTLTIGTTYYFSVKAQNGAGLQGTARNSNGQVVLQTQTQDTTPPTNITAVNDGTGTDIGSTASLTQLSANWTAAADAQSGISGYKYAIGTTAGGTNIVGWTTLGSVLSVTKTGLTLTAGTTYYFSVKAVNGVGLESVSAKNSDGICVTAQGGTGTGADPVISGIGVTNLTDRSATIIWDTDLDTKGQVQYGTTLNYIGGGEESTQGKRHIVDIKSLEPETRYHYRVVNIDGDGKTTQSGDYTFKTYALITRPTPMVGKVYPNPYKLAETSQMTFALSSATGGSIKIYTLSGKLVKNISVTSGNTDALWNLTNETGNRINGGLYVYIMSDSDGNKKTGKIVITN